MKFTTISALSRASTGVGAMEKDLHERDRVGVQDFVLLEDFQSEDAFIDNLRKRFRENLIYTYIGQVLVSMNPYKNLPIYTTEVVKDYQGAHFYEAPPHVFAIGDAALRSLIEERIEQCILISGESGSGKTEASKKVLQFIAASTSNRTTVENVKDKLLQSNPVLEAFGNAKTNRNNNSSRFGKYMDISFDFRGTPIGGNILNYLLEKSRVVHQAHGDRNFHIFYELIEGADESLLQDLHLKRNFDNYYYLSNGSKGSSGMDDRAQFSVIRHAMNTLEMSVVEQQAMFNIVASVLHLGNVGFTENDGKAEILKPECISYISELLGCNDKKLGNALTHRTIDARGDVVTSPLNREMAIYARDALAKAIYDRMFSWLVDRLNRTLNSNISKAQENKVMGILDIYGFEIFQKNSFEQFCINYCNEKLQQLFIELTLKSEQDEYLKEGIEWEPVEYFDNKVICDLIEEKHRGIISLLDEECLRPGEPTDQSFLQKMNQFLTRHRHYVSHMKADLKIQKIMGRDEFQLKHYAGEVIYNVKGFLDKNNDLLFRDLREVMSETNNFITQCVFPRSEIVIKKRPETAITQFKNSLAGLMQTLMGKQPSYIRCIKPNDMQASGQFDENIVRHQVKYLGLMENLRVRRAGFAYRRPYEMFLKRYKCLSPFTWPNYKGPAKEGVRQLMKHMSYTSEDFKMGETKIFIRFPKTLFTIEDDFQKKKHDIAAIIQKVWKGRQQRKRYLEIRQATIVIEKWVRMFLAKRRAKRRQFAVQTIRNFIEGFITRNGPKSDLNQKFIELAKRHYLLWLSKNLPKKLTENPWNSEVFNKRCPHVCKEATLNIRIIHRNWLARKFRKSLTPQMKKQFELKVLAESIFKGKKQSYPSSIGPHFINDRLTEEHKPLRDNFVRTQLQSGEEIVYSISVTKYDRHGYKPRERALLISTKSIYVLDGKTFKQKHCLAHSMIQELCVTSSNDDLIVLRIPPEQKKDKGDLILKATPVIETVTFIIDTIKKPELCKVQGSETIYHNLTNGKKGQIDIVSGDVSEIKKGTTGHLVAVVSQS